MTNENTKLEVQNHYPISIVSENENYTVVRNSDGKYARKPKYIEYSSVPIETREEKIWLLNLLEGVDGTAIGLKDCVGEIIEIENIIVRPYDSINEDTGEFDYGVLTYLITPEKQVYVTSAKAVYFTIKRILDYLGKPNTSEWDNVKVAVIKTKMENGDAISIKMVE